MSRLSLLSNPLLLGFDEIERLVDRASKGANDGYPPYNVERIGAQNGTAELLRISLAVAGFTRDQLDITLEDRQLTIRGKQQEDKGREFLYRGIAARQFTRTFVLAEGIEVDRPTWRTGCSRSTWSASSRSAWCGQLRSATGNRGSRRFVNELPSRAVASQRNGPSRPLRPDWKARRAPAEGGVAS